MGAGLEPLFVDGGGTVSGLSDHLVTAEKLGAEIAQSCRTGIAGLGVISGGFLIFEQLAKRVPDTAPCTAQRGIEGPQ